MIGGNNEGHRGGLADVGIGMMSVWLRSLSLAGSLSLYFFFFFFWSRVGLFFAPNNSLLRSFLPMIKSEKPVPGKVRSIPPKT